MKKLLVGILAASVPMLAGASFDMLLVLDNANNLVHRIDPVHRIYLGSFGVGRLQNSYGMAVNQSLGRAYVSNVGRNTVSTWDYNTGEFIDEFSITGTAVNVSVASNGDLFVGSTTGAFRYSQAGALLTTYRAVGSGAMFSGPSGEVYVSDYSGSGDKMYRYTLGGTLVSTSAAYPSPFFAGFHAAVRGSDMFMTSGSTSSSSNRFMRVNAGAPPTFGPPISGGGFDTIYGVAFGHSTTLWLGGGLTAGGYGISGYNYSAGQFDTTTQTYSQIGNVFAVSSVLAPEPASMTALALGLGVLIRRRKSR